MHVLSGQPDWNNLKDKMKINTMHKKTEHESRLTGGPTRAQQVNQTKTKQKFYTA